MDKISENHYEQVLILTMRFYTLLVLNLKLN